MIPAVIPIGIAIITAAYNGYTIYSRDYAPLDCTFNQMHFRHNIKHLIYGQTDAVNVLTQALSINSGYGAHVLLFTGGPGVGKTYAASIIKANYKPREMIVSILPSVQPLNVTTLSLTKHTISRVTNGFGIVIIDGIDFKNIDLQEFLLRMDSFSKKNKIVVKIIVIGNILKMYVGANGEKSVDQFKTDQDYLGYLNAVSRHTLQLYNNFGIKNCEQILFLPLTKDAVKECVTFAAKAQRKQISEQDLEQITDNVMGQKSNFSPSGCKDVDSYVNILK